MYSTFDQYEYSPSITTSENSPINSSESYFQSFPCDELADFTFLDDEMQEVLPTEISARVQEISSAEIEDVCRWLDESEGEAIFSSPISVEVQNVCSPDFSTKSYDASESMILPVEDMEVDNHLSLSHLLKAYCEDIDEGHSQLAEVIVGCVKEKISPVGETVERVLFNLFLSTENHGNYMKQEATKNYEAAFRAFYGSFPYGRIPHFAANSAILEAMPNDSKRIHIIDFDMGAGVQWAPIIEAIGRRQKALVLTSIKIEENSVGSPAIWKFEETKRRLYEYARSFGVTLKVQETRLVDLVNYIRESNGSEWLVFNCMTNLPHMGRRRCRSDVMEFLNTAQAVLANSATNKGLLTVGHGEAAERMKNGSTFSLYFDQNLRHYQALYESMECNFPACFAEARLAMESLFLAPYVSSLSSLDRWEEMKNGPAFDAGSGLRGWSMSKESLMEAREMVKEGESLYNISKGHNDNEMILEWRGSPLVRVSTWM